MLSLLLPTGSCNTLADSKLLGLGYDLLRANPEGGRFSTSGLDPGVKPTRQILNIDDTNRNFLIRVDNVTFCTNHTTYEYFSDTKTKQEYLLRDYVTSGDGDMLIRPYAFMAGSALDSALIPNVITIAEITVCNRGRSRYVMPPAYPSLHILNDEFVAAVCSLSTLYDPTVYSQFLKDWGTHVIIEVETGTKTVGQYEIPATNVAEELFKKYTQPPIWKIEIVKDDGSIAYLNTSNLRTSDLKTLTTGNLHNQLNVGRMGTSEPLEFHLVSIARFLNDDFWTNENIQHWDSICPNMMQRNFSVIKQNLLKAMNEYPSFYHIISAPTEYAHTLSVPLIWPTGTFSLYQPSSGCPHSHIWFETGWRYYDSEDDTGNNSWSSGHHLAGDTHNKGNSKFYFCFDEGYIHWDDENNNANSMSGTLPYGTYSTDTEIYFCCRSDGPIANKIFLPVDKPFFLMRYTSGCQRIYGMTVREEFFHFNDEDTGNKDSCHGAHPYDTTCTNDHTLFFCYYEVDHKGSSVFG
ncbi:Hypothetical predicted protein [Mytilus galloprovincialis]|uniref:MACPF domain-containing protein n=1 Tax=Mytilus galloprovincialis TaxID=29158 RepID=A0A8B6ENK9_MYTGA|nr:Hypothetical predicted protein [Mytilus galloprovincialis]